MDKNDRKVPPIWSDHYNTHYIGPYEVKAQSQLGEDDWYSWRLMARRYGYAQSFVEFVPKDQANEGMAPLIVAGMNLRQHWQDVEDYVALDASSLVHRAAEIRRRTEQTKLEFLQALEDALAAAGAKKPMERTFAKIDPIWRGEQ